MDLRKLQNAVEDVSGLTRGTLYKRIKKQAYTDGRKLFAIIAQRNGVGNAEIGEFTQNESGTVREWIKRGDELYLYDKVFCEKYRQVINTVVTPLKIEKNAEAVNEFNRIIERLLTLDPTAKASIVSHIKGM